MWSSLQETDARGGMNIVASEVAVGESIIAYLLTKKGEDPFAPEYGLDIEIFSNLNDFDADIWAFYVQDKLKQYVVGLSAINVSVAIEPIDGKATAYINYTTDISNSRNTLTFPYHTYTGVQSGDANILDFLDSITINDNRFSGLALA
jgi:hypothetical protein